MSGTLIDIAAARVAAVRSSGRCNRTTNPVVRSTRVPIAEPEAVLPRIRSPSQWPGSRGPRPPWTITDVDHVFEFALTVFLAALRFSLSATSAQRGLDQPGQLPTRLDVEGLIDRLV